MMPENETSDKNPPPIAALYPELTPSQQEEAEFCLSHYLDVVRRIFERITVDKPNLLTKIEKSANLKQKSQ